MKYYKLKLSLLPIFWSFWTHYNHIKMKRYFIHSKKISTAYVCSSILIHMNQKQRDSCCPSNHLSPENPLRRQIKFGFNSNAMSYTSPDEPAHTASGISQILYNFFSHAVLRGTLFPSLLTQFLLHQAKHEAQLFYHPLVPKKITWL